MAMRYVGFQVAQDLQDTHDVLSICQGSHRRALPHLDEMDGEQDFLERNMQRWQDRAYRRSN